MMSQPDSGSVARIAIALAVLRHKPSHRSIASYLLDLHSRFPLQTERNDGREWRAYALELEVQIAALKARRDADQELLSKFSANASQSTSTSDVPPKKKSKKNSSKDQPDTPDVRWEQSRSDWSRLLSSQYPSSPSLLAAFTSLKGVLASPNADLTLHVSRLTDAILRTLDAIHAFLFSVPNPTLDTHTQPTPFDPQHVDSARIAMATPLLIYFLRTALPALLHIAQGDPTKSKRPRERIHATAVPSIDLHVDAVLNRLLECVLLPLIRALSPLCLARLAPLVTPIPKKLRRPVGKGKDKDKQKRADAPPDTRSDVFALIGTSLEALDALPSLVRLHVPARRGDATIASGIRDRLGLETIRELEALYPTPPNTSQPVLPSMSDVTVRSSSRVQCRAGTRAERVRALATRDAGWFLASTLNLCLTLPPPPPTAASPFLQCAPADPGGLLRKALLDRIGKLVLSVPLSSDTIVSTAAADGPRENDGKRAAGSSTPSTHSPTIDPVCRNMLLAICERAMTQLATSTPQ